ncbi:MAG: CvpA family protein [Fidelibacterota bacterium]
MNHIFDLTALLIIGAMAAVGYNRGFLEELGRIIGLIVSSIASLKYYEPVAGWLQARVLVDPKILSFFSFLAVFLAFLFTIRLLTKMLQVFMLSQGIRWANKSLGLVFGGLKGLVSVMVILWTVDIAPNPQYFNGLKIDSYVYRHLSGYRKWVVHSFGIEDSVAKSESWVKEKMGVE